MRRKLSINFNDMTQKQEKKIKKVVKNFRRKEDGNIAIMSAFGIGAMMVVGSVVLDLTMVSSTDNRAQTIADAVALSAAIYVNKKGQKPSSKSEGLVGTYTAAQLGYDFSDKITNGGQSVIVEVIYDDAKGEATAIVTGKNTTTFKGIMGKDSLPFRAEASVAYGISSNQQPASVALVLDTSGSMLWDDRVDSNPSNDEFESSSTVPGAKSRNAALISSAKGFMTTLKKYESDPGEDRVVRTGLYAYESIFSNSRSSPMQWKTLSTSSNSKLSRLPASGGTNSGAAMTKVATQMSLENNIHYLENGENNPLKFVVFMTDGSNNYTAVKSCKDEYRPAHKHWVYNYTVTTGWGWYRRSQKKQLVEESRFKPTWKPWDDYNSWNNKWQQVQVGANKDTEHVCDVSSTYDTTTVAQCQAMAADGVVIHTIGYGLEPGYYHRRDGYSYNYQRTTEGYIYEKYHIYIDKAITDRAYNMLKTCADVSGGTFYAAKDASQLNAAFTDIGNSIQRDLVRLTN